MKSEPEYTEIYLKYLQLAKTFVIVWLLDLGAIRFLVTDDNKVTYQIKRLEIELFFFHI